MKIQAILSRVGPEIGSRGSDASCGADGSLHPKRPPPARSAHHVSTGTPDLLRAPGRWPGVPLTDAQWTRIEPLLPDRTPRRGGRWRDHRLLIDAIAFKYRTGTPWTDLPEKYGSWKGVHNRLRNWAVDGTWKRVFTALLAQSDAEGDLEWAVAVDSTIVRAHQHAAGARSKASPNPGR